MVVAYLFLAMSAVNESPTSLPSAVNDFDDEYDPNKLARELMMPAGEPAAAVIGACLLLGMIWFVASGHFFGGSQALHAASAERAVPTLNANGGAIPPPTFHRSAG